MKELNALKEKFTYLYAKGIYDHSLMMTIRAKEKEIKNDH